MKADAPRTRANVHEPKVLDEAPPLGARGGTKPGANEPIGLSAGDLQMMTFEPINYVVTGYIVEGLTLFAGKPKVGKSWLMLHAAIAVAAGGYTFGDVKCEEGDVLYAALEDNNRRLQRRMTKLLGLQPWPARLRTITTMPKLREGGVALIREWIKQAKNPRLCIIDTFAKVRSGKGKNETDYEADYAAVAELKALADEHGVAIVLVHHVRKMDADDPLDTVSGTTGLTGAPDAVLVLHRSHQGTTLYGRGRDIEEIEKAVEFDRATCVWHVLGEASEVQRSSERAKILSVLIDATEPIRPGDLSTACEMKRANVDQLLFKMAKAGDVRKVGRGRYVHPERNDLLP